MSDQIIIEFIGDPSGLKPAEEALRGLGKSSQDTVAAFEKANAAAKKFAEGAKEAATAIGSTGDAAEKSVKALSTLSQAIGSGAVKAVAEDFKAWAKEVTELGIRKGELKQKLADVTTEMDKAKAAIKTNKDEYAALGKEAKALEKDMNSTGAAMDKYEAASAKAATKNIELNDKLEKTRAAIAAMNGTSEEGSAKYNKLVASAEKLESQIAKNDKTITDNAAKTHVLGETNRSLAEQYDNVKGKMDTASTAVAQNKTHLAELGKESKTLKGDINGVDKKIADTTKSFGENSKAAKESTHSITSMIGNAKKLISAVGEMDAAFLSATGNEREANKVRERTTEVLQAFATVEAVVTTATEAWSVATGIATAATTALDVALGPIAIIVGAIVAVVALAAAHLVIFHEAGKKVVEVVEEKLELFKNLKPIIDSVVEGFNAFKDVARDVVSVLSGGLIEDSALHAMNDSLEKAAKDSEKLSAEFKKQADLMEAEGRSAKEVAETRLSALKEEQNALASRLQLEKHGEKNEELRNQLNQNTIGLIEQQKNKIEGVATELQKQGKSEGQILEIKEKQIQALMDQFLAQSKNLELSEEIRVSAAAQYQAMKNMLSETMEAHKAYNKEKAKQDYADALESAKLTADLRLALAKEGSEEELQARLKDMKAATDIELNNDKLTLTQRALIKTRLAQDTAKEIEAHYNKALEDEVKNVAKGSEEEYKIKMDVLSRERAAIAHNDKLSAEQKLEMFTQVNEQEDQIWKTYNDARAAKEKAALDAKIAEVRKADKQELEDIIKTNQEELRNENLTATQRMLITKNLLAAQMQLEIDAVNANGKNKEDNEKAISDIISRYRMAAIKADKDNEISTINETIAAMQKKGAFASQIEREKMKLIDAEKKENEKLHEQGLISEKAYQDKKVALEKKSSEQKAAINKADMDIAKQVGQKLIEMAKQVSDAIFENQKQKRDNDLKDKIDNLEAHKEAELMNTTLTAAQRKAIEKKYKIEEAQAKEKAWKADQKAKAEQAIINGLLAFTSALFSSPPPMNYVNAAIALASAGVQAGIIMSKTPPKFAKGVVALEGPGTETSDSIPAYLSRGESVITASATRRYQPLLEAMNAGTLDRYMALPLMPDVKALEDATRTTHRAQAEKIDYEKIGEVLARRINMKQLNVSIDEKGFTKSVVSRGQRITSYNDRMKF